MDCRPSGLVDAVRYRSFGPFDLPERVSHLPEAVRRAGEDDLLRCGCHAGGTVSLLSPSQSGDCLYDPLSLPLFTGKPVHYRQSASVGLSAVGGAAEGTGRARP